MSNCNKVLPPEGEPRKSSIAEQALAALRQRGNPFRQQFARNSDDAYCSIYHVGELFADERAMSRALVDAYRGQPARPTAVLPILGARGSGKTHLLHWLKHDPKSPQQLFVTPGTFRMDSAGNDAGFLEYLLFQLVNVLLGGGEQRGARPIQFVGERLTRRVLADLLPILDVEQRLAISATAGIRRSLWKVGIGVRSAAAAFDALRENLKLQDRSCRTLVAEAGIDAEGLVAAATDVLERSEARDLKGEYRKRALMGFLHATLLADSAPLADFLTDGFADVSFLARPTRTYMTLTLLQALTELIVGSGIPIGVAFDQLEELLYGQTEDEIRRSSDGFFGGLVQLLSQAPGLCALLFVEEGLWNRIVPQLSPHILDRLHEPLNIPGYGDVRTIRLRTPTLTELVEVVACRVRRTLSGFEGMEHLPPSFPFQMEFLEKLVRRETVLRLMLQGCCARLDEIFHSGLTATPQSAPPADKVMEDIEEPAVAADDWRGRWGQEVRACERKLQPVGSLAGATIELAGGLSRLLEILATNDQTEIVGNVDGLTVGNHPTYGLLSVANVRLSEDGVRRVAIGLWLGRGVGKPRDLETKLEAFAVADAALDRLVLLRPDDDARLSGRTLQVWNAAIDAGRPIVMATAGLAVFAGLHALPRWLQQVREQQPDGSLPSDAVAHLREQFAAIIESMVGAEAALPPAKLAA